MKKLFAVFGMGALILGAGTQQAFAYVDPSAVTMFFQIIVAGVVGVLVFIRIYIHKIFSVLVNLYSSVRGIQLDRITTDKKSRNNENAG